MRQTKDFRFIEIKAIEEDGTFTGYLSVFDIVDLGNDLVEKGAFAKTITEHAGKIPMLWQHDTKQPIGTLELKEDDVGLRVDGHLLLEVQRAKEAYALIKANVIRGLSIGFEAVKKTTEKGIRHLKEIRLFEGSIVTFPMMPLALITDVKTGEQKADFITELEQAQTYMMRRMMMESLMSSLDSIAWDNELDADTKLQQSDESIQQFHSAYVEFLPKLLALWGEKTAPDATEEKAGRRLSAASRAQIEEAITKLQALLTDVATSEEIEEAGKSATQQPPEQDSIKPEVAASDLHLLLKQFDFTPLAQ